MSKAPQSAKNHGRFDPLFHFFLAPVSLANVIVAIVALVHRQDFFHWWMLVLSIAAFILLFKLRNYPLKVQDRVIRLEETAAAAGAGSGGVARTDLPAYRGSTHRTSFRKRRRSGGAGQAGARAQSDPQADQGADQELAGGRVAGVRTGRPGNSFAWLAKVSEAA